VTVRNGTIDGLACNAHANSVPAGQGVGILIGLAAASTGVASPIDLMGLKPWHILMVCAMAFALVTTRGSIVRALRIGSTDIALLMFVFFTGVSELINSGSLRYGFDFVSVLSPLYYFAGYLAARLVVQSEIDLRKFLTALTLPAICVSIVCLGQFFSDEFASFTLSVAPAPSIDARIESGGYVRATGLIGHWTGVGFYFTVVIAIVCVLALINKQSGRKPLPGLLVAIGASASVGILTTLTFAVIATSLIIVSVTAIKLNVRVGGVAAAGAVILVLFALFGDMLEERVRQQQMRSAATLPSWVPNTIAYRWQIWTEQTIPAISDRLTWGWGTNVYSPTNPSRIRPTGLLWLSPESQWFAILISFGVVATLCFMVLCYAILRSLIRISRNGGSVVVPFVALVVCVILTSTIVSVFTNRGFPAIFWPALGAVYAVYCSTRATRRASGSMEPFAGSRRYPSEVLMTPDQTWGRARG